MDYLIHFTKYKNLLAIIESKGIKFCKMSKTNDPYENSDLISEILVIKNGDNNIYCYKDLIFKRSIKEKKIAILKP